MERTGGTREPSSTRALPRRSVLLAVTALVVGAGVGVAHRATSSTSSRADTAANVNDVGTAPTSSAPTEPSLATPTVLPATSAVPQQGTVAAKPRGTTQPSTPPTPPQISVASAAQNTPLAVTSTATGEVTWEGLGTLVANTRSDSTLTYSGLSGVAQVRTTIATFEGNDVYGVAGLEAQVRTGGAAKKTASNTNGALTTPIAGGAPVTYRWAFPPGEYAIITDFLSNDATLITSRVISFAVESSDSTPAVTSPTPPEPTTSTTPPQGSTDTPQTTDSTSPTTTSSPSSRAPSTTSPDAPTSSSTTTTTPTEDSTSTTTTDPTADTSTTTTSTTPETTTTTTTTPDSPPSATTTTEPAANDIPSEKSSSTTVPKQQTSTSTTTSTTPSTTTTTTTPSAVTAGPWALKTVRPNSGPLAGGQSVTVTGNFPDNVKLYAWWGPDMVTPLTKHSDEVYKAETPKAEQPGVVDVTVKFTTDKAWELSLDKAYTFTDPDAPTSGSTTSTTAPTGSGTVGVLRRGRLSLHPPAPGSPIARYKVGALRTGRCTTSSCTASS